ncbi:MAG: hypothetical protein WB662_07655, partial [Methyloceanibacter sp.]
MSSPHSEQGRASLEFIVRTPGVTFENNSRNGQFTDLHQPGGPSIAEGRVSFEQPLNAFGQHLIDSRRRSNRNHGSSINSARTGPFRQLRLLALTKLQE